MQIKIAQTNRDISSSGKGSTIFRFVCLPGATRWTKPSALDGAVLLEQVSWGHRTDDRHSATSVEVDLPVGTLLREFVRDETDRSRSKTSVERLDAAGEWQKLPHKTVRRGDGWVTVVTVDGEQLEIA